MTLDDRLKNWGRWARVGIKLGQCGSAEGNYRSNWRQWLALSDIPHSEPIDAFDAEEVEAAWVRMFDRQEHKLLKLKYVTRLPVVGYKDEDGRYRPGICDKLRIREGKFDAIHSRARYHISLLLDKKKNLMYKGDKFNTLPEKVEAQTAPMGAVLSLETGCAA